MPEHVVARLGELLNEQEKPIKGSKVLVMGVAYKKDCADTRESPAEDVMTLLRERGADLCFHDPYVGAFDVDGESVRSVALDKETIVQQDAVLIITDHSDVDYDLVSGNAKLVFDTRNAMKKAEGDHENVVKL